MSAILAPGRLKRSVPREHDTGLFVQFLYELVGGTEVSP